jgi:hypothetical protein
LLDGFAAEDALCLSGRPPDGGRPWGAASSEFKGS